MLNFTGNLSTPFLQLKFQCVAEELMVTNYNGLDYSFVI
jgi:hypothetical protein